MWRNDGNFKTPFNKEKTKLVPPASDNFTKSETFLCFLTAVVLKLSATEYKLGLCTALGALDVSFCNLKSTEWQQKRQKGLLIETAVKFVWEGGGGGGDVNNYNNYYNFDFYSAKVLIALRRFICTENKNYKNKLWNLQVLNIKYEKRAIKVYLKNKVTNKQTNIRRY